MSTPHSPEPAGQPDGVHPPQPDGLALNPPSGPQGPPPWAAPLPDPVQESPLPPAGDPDVQAYPAPEPQQYVHPPQYSQYSQYPQQPPSEQSQPALPSQVAEQQVAEQQYAQPAPTHYGQAHAPLPQQYAQPDAQQTQTSAAGQYQTHQYQYQYQDPGQYHSPYQYQPGSPTLPPGSQAPQAGKPGRMWILWVSMAAGLVVILALIAAAYQYSRFLTSIGSLSSPTVTHEPMVTQVSETPLYLETDEYLSGMVDEYGAMSIDALAALFPGGAVGYDSSYVLDFQLALGGLQEQLEEVGALTAYEPTDFDYELYDIQDEAAETERRFLAQEDLGQYFTLQQEDGTTYQSDGRYFPQGTPALNAEREAFAQSFVPYLDGNGTYAAAGEELVAGLSMRLSYDFPEMFVYCPADGFTIQDTGSIGAAYCPSVHDTIYVNAQGNNYPALLADPYYIDLLKHEFAHVRTTGICATSQPGVTLGGAHFEATASSYAAMFLGADRDRLAWAAADFPAYTMTPETDQAAQLIHDGTCG